MNKLLIIIFLLLQGVAMAKQRVSVADGTGNITSYAVLPDSGYTFSEVLTNDNLNFIEGGLIDPSKNAVYWLKITIAIPATDGSEYNLFVNYHANNILYYLDANLHKWISDSAGFILKKRTWTEFGAMPLLLQPVQNNIVYLKLDASVSNKTGYVIHPEFVLQKRSISINKQQFLWTGWVIALAVVLFFFLYNLYIYFSFRDASTIYYLIVQLGIITYITSYSGYFNILLPVKIFTIRVFANGLPDYYTFNNLVNHVSVAVVLYGFVQLTRAYLNTPKNLPNTDKVLKCGLLLYITGTTTFCKQLFEKAK